MSRRIVVFYQDASDEAVPVVLTCKNTLIETITEALQEFELDTEEPRRYALCLNFQELTVRLSESAFANLPTTGRPPQLRLISLADLKELSKTQFEHKTWDDAQLSEFSQQPNALQPTSSSQLSVQSSQQPHHHHHQQPSQQQHTASSSSNPKKRGRKSAAELRPPAQPTAGDTNALWLAGGPGQGSDNDSSQRYRKRRVILGQPKKQQQQQQQRELHEEEDSDSVHAFARDQSMQSHQSDEEDGFVPPTAKRPRGRPRRSAADSAAEAISQDASNNGEAVPAPAQSSLPAAISNNNATTAKAPSTGKRGRPRKIRPSATTPDANSQSGSQQEQQQHESSTQNDSREQTEAASTAAAEGRPADDSLLSSSNAVVPLPYNVLLDTDVTVDRTSPLQIAVPLSDAAIDFLQEKPEPDRTRFWLAICFEENLGSSVPQRDVWSAYQRHTAQYPPDTADGLQAQNLIRLIPTLFRSAGAETIQTPEGKAYIISNLRSRHVPSWYALKLGHVRSQNSDPSVSQAARSAATPTPPSPRREETETETSQTLSHSAGGQTQAQNDPQNPPRPNSSHEQVEEEEVIRESSSEAQLPAPVPNDNVEEAQMSSSSHALPPTADAPSPSAQALNSRIEDASNEVNEPAEEPAAHLHSPQRSHDDSAGGFTAVDQSFQKPQMTVSSTESADGSAQPPSMAHDHEAEESLAAAVAAGAVPSTRSASPSSSEGDGGKARHDRAGQAHEASEAPQDASLETNSIAQVMDMSAYEPQQQQQHAQPQVSAEGRSSPIQAGMDEHHFQEHHSFFYT